MAIHLRCELLHEDDECLDYSFDLSPGSEWPRTVLVRFFKDVNAPYPVFLGELIMANRLAHKLLRTRAKLGRWPKGEVYAA